MEFIAQQVRDLELSDGVATQIWKYGVEIHAMIRRHETDVMDTSHIRELVRLQERERAQEELQQLAYEKQRALDDLKRAHDELQRVQESVARSQEEMRRALSDAQGQRMTDLQRQQQELREVESRCSLRVQQLKVQHDEEIQRYSDRLTQLLESQHEQAVAFQEQYATIIHDVETKWEQQETSRRAVLEQELAFLKQQLQCEQSDRRVEREERWQEKQHWVSRLDQWTQQQIQRHSSVARGQEGEAKLEELLRTILPRCVIEDHRKDHHCGDYWLIDDERQLTIMLDSKEYKAAVPRSQLDKLMSDMDRHVAVHAGLLVSMKSHVSGLGSFTFLYSPQNKPVLVISLADGEPEKMLRYALGVLEQLVLYARQHAQEPMITQDLLSRMVQSLKELKTAKQALQQARDAAKQMIANMEQMVKQRERELQDWIQIIQTHAPDAMPICVPRTPDDIAEHTENPVQSDAASNAANASSAVQGKTSKRGRKRKVDQL
jgi:hypothetical protein